MNYIIQPWEPWKTVDMIASRFGVTADRLVKANPILSSVPVYPGMILDVPGREETDPADKGYIAYMAQPDDSFFRLASIFRLNYDKLVAQNTQIENPYIIWPGQIIYLVYSDS